MDHTTKGRGIVPVTPSRTLEGTTAYEFTLQPDGRFYQEAPEVNVRFVASSDEHAAYTSINGISTGRHVGVNAYDALESLFNTYKSHKIEGHRFEGLEKLSEELTFSD